MLVDGVEIVDGTFFADGIARKCRQPGQPGITECGDRIAEAVGDERDRHAEQGIGIRAGPADAIVPERFRGCCLVISTGR